MKILIACETSGTVRNAFRERGHDAWSCDVLPSVEDSSYHYQRPLEDIMTYGPYGWEMLVAHPPCTFLCSSGLFRTTRGERPQWKTDEALAFVRYIMDLDIPKICIENPVGCISTRIRKPDQYINPYLFGENASKKTGLWLKGLPLLKPTIHCEPEYYACGRKSCRHAEKYESREQCPKCRKPLLPRWGNQTPSG